MSQDSGSYLEGRPTMAAENPYRYALILVAVLQLTVFGFYLAKAGLSVRLLRQRDEGVVLTVLIMTFYSAYVIAIAVYLFAPERTSWSAVPLPAWVCWSGMVPLLFGVTALSWALHRLGRNLTISIATKRDHELITSGPYSWVRHPLYSAGMIASVGVALLMANWFVAVAAAVFWSLIMYRTPMEEERLIATFGFAYQQYAQRVGRFVPKLWSSVEPIKRPSS